MSTSLLSTLTATTKKRSSSFCINILNENSPTHPASFLKPPVDLQHQSSTETQDSFSSPISSDRLLQTPKSFTRTRPRLFSTTISTKSARIPSRDRSWEASFLSPDESEDIEILYDDDEEINPKDEVHVLKEGDLEISIEMITKEMIMSSEVPLSYPCHISIKPTEEILVERPSMDLLLIIDLKDRKTLSILDVLQKFLPYLSDKDRLSLFTTQGVLMKRFPFRVMDEPTKSEFINEYHVLGNVMNANRRRRNSLNQVFESALFALQQRRYKSQVSSILIITDTNDEINPAKFSNKNILEGLEDQPLVYAYGLGQKHDPFKLQNVCQDFEGNYSYVETCGELYEAMKGSLGEISFIQGKNMRLSLEMSSGEGVKISKVYDRKGNLEEGTMGYKTQRNYYSIKDGIELALEIELSKCKQIMDVKKCEYYLELEMTGESINQGNLIEMKFRKEFVIKMVPPLLCSMPKMIDRIALENFCRVKAIMKCMEVLKMIEVVGNNQSVQTLEGVRKELCCFSKFKSDVIQRVLKKIERGLIYLEDLPAKPHEKFLFVKEMNANILASK